MEPQVQPTHNPKVMKWALILGVVVIVIGGLLLLGGGEGLPDLGMVDSGPKKLVVENTKPVNGVVGVPQDFPKEIPVETGWILDSSTVSIPGVSSSVRPMNVSYVSNQSLSAKYQEYKNYLTNSGYQIEEDNSTGSQIRSIYATRSSELLSLVVSAGSDGTLVQLGYVNKGE